MVNRSTSELVTIAQDPETEVHEHIEEMDVEVGMAEEVIMGR